MPPILVIARVVALVTGRWYLCLMPEDEIHTGAAGMWTLGDLTVNRIGFGTKRLSGSTAFDLGNVSDRDRVIGLLRQAIELGVNHIDTAAFYPTYAPDQPVHDSTPLNWANEMINRALAPYPGDLVIATKVGPVAGGLARPDELRGQVEENLRQLGRDYLDVVYLRQAGLDSVAEHFGALAELRDAGLIRHLGLSNVRPHHLAQAQDVAPVVCVQNRYGVDFGRVNDEMLRTCGEQASRSCPSSPSPPPGGRPAVSPATTRYWPWPAPTGQPRRRFASPGPCTAGPTCWPSLAQATQIT